MICLFVAACITVSLLLPRWQQEQHTERSHNADAYLTAALPVAAATIAPSPHQRDAAGEAYARGASELKAKNYPAAAVYFKKALEKYPTFTEAYAGLAEAADAVGDDQAAVLNAQHALDQWAGDQIMHVVDLTPATGSASAHRVLGAALLRRADAELHLQQALIGKMAANRAAFHCRQAISLDAAGNVARRCAEHATALASST